MPTLYRKYRPQVFSEVTGQDTIVQTLQNEIALNRLAHAYLFSGPRGVGKTTLARILAKAVGCEQRKDGASEPCNHCAACVQINNGRHIDIFEIDAASQTGVDNVRENIIENAGVMPTSLKYKIFIIDEVHMLSTSAFNALLKTLEEPPAHVIFILATTELHKLPATVISRCERFAFKKIAYEKMVERLKELCKEEKVKVEKEVLERIARKSDGGLRDAESLLGQILSLSLKEITADDIQMVLPLSSAESIIEYVGFLVEGEVGPAITLINRQAEEGVNLDQFAFDLLETLRAMLILLLNADKNSVRADYSEETLKTLRKLATAIGPARLVVLMDLALKRKTEIKAAPLPQLPLELLAVEASGLFSNLPTATPTNSSEILATPVTSTPVTSVPKPTVKTPDESPIAQLKSTIKSAISHLSSETPIATTLDQIKTRWNEVIAKATGALPSLTIILKMCTLSALNGNVLTIAVPYSLHKDKLEQLKTKNGIENCLEELFSEKIRLVCVVVSEEKPPEQNSELSALAAEFGGEVVG